VLPVLLALTFGVSTIGVSRSLKQLIKPSLGWAFFLLPVAWYLAAFQRGGEAFIDRQLIFENVRRVVGGEHMNTQPWWFYLPSLARTTFPWWLLCGYLMVQFFPFLKPGLHRHEEESTTLPPALHSHTRFRFVPIFCFLAGLILFSIPSGKRHSYLLSLLPFIALQIAVLLSEVIHREGLSGRAGILKCINSIGAALIPVSVLFVGTVALFGENIGPITPLRLGLQPYLHAITPPLVVVLASVVIPLAFFKSAPFGSQLKRVWFGLFVVVS
jgi:4-amino-4-deoxy-L-arabinose transferase-like glycosyltransferase